MVPLPRSGCGLRCGLRLDTQNHKRVPAKENRVPIGGIGPKKGSMAKIGKGQKRAPETP